MSPHRKKVVRKHLGSETVVRKLNVNKKAKQRLVTVTDKIKAENELERKEAKGKNRRKKRYPVKERKEQDCRKALAMEKFLNDKEGRLLLKIVLPDRVINETLVKSWSNSIQAVICGNTIGPRSFYVVMKNNARMKNAVKKIQAVRINGGRLKIEETTNGAYNSADSYKLIDPYTLYVSNLNKSVKKDEIKFIFKNCDYVTRPRKMSPRIDNNPSPNFCFVTYSSPKEARKALEENFNKKILNATMLLRYRRVSKQKGSFSQPRDMPNQQLQEKLNNSTSNNTATNEEFNESLRSDIEAKLKSLKEHLSSDEDMPSSYCEEENSSEESIEIFE